MAKYLAQIEANFLTYRRYYFVATFVVVVIVLASFGFRSNYVAHQELPASATSSTQAVVLSKALPVRIKIPRIGVDAPFESPLGLEADGEVQVPKAYDTVGYYQFGPTPGELGPAVVLGHVDSYIGPAVFFSLGQLDEGDQIVIERADGIAATFAVTTLERHEQSGFPTRQVYGDLGYAGLRLITCSGVYDQSNARYTHNLIVFAKLVSTSTHNNIE